MNRKGIIPISAVLVTKNLKDLVCLHLPRGQNSYIAHGRFDSNQPTVISLYLVSFIIANIPEGGLKTVTLGCFPALSAYQF
jgi:hypothetical protein